jgi:2-methylcitrate dehydratase PrpD
MAISERSKTAKTPLVKQIAERILEFDSKSIPDEVLQHAKFLILDSIGCALAARGEHAFDHRIQPPDAGHQRGDAQWDSHPRAGPE